jgi:HPt (histidine-containing phosphotransfer) domain-containing protein
MVNQYIQHSKKLSTMTHSITFLPGFNASQIEKYFFNDADAIKEIFKITNDNLTNDLNRIAIAIEENDITELQRVLHSIKPVFNFIGLPVLEAEILGFYKLSLQATTIANIKHIYSKVWPELLNANKLIAAQHQLFETQTAGVA